MRLQFTTGCFAAALTWFGAAVADQTPGRSAAEPDKVTGDMVVQVAALTQEIAQFASTAEVVASPLGAPAEKVQATDRPTTGVAEPPKRIVAGKRGGTERSTGLHTERLRLASADPQAGAVRVIGRTEVGTAAWYGGRYIGRRTTSGARLDTVHPTAAHRTLPLNSLARVTNLENGRSVIVRVTDRGPVSESLLIDMSPRAAAQLAMKDAGLAEVRVEQVVPVSRAAK